MGEATTNGHSGNGTASNGLSIRSNEVYLVTGGLGSGLVALLLQRPLTTVVAAVRDVKSTAVQRLGELPEADGSKLIIIQIDSAIPEDPARAAEELQTAHGIRHINVIIANAAIAEDYGPTSTATLENIQKHMMINAYAPLLLFQAMKSLLAQAPPNQSQFVLVGAPISTITEMESCARAPLGLYGVSKLAACYFTRKLHFENKWLIAYVVDPGHVQTDMGDQGARLMGRKEAPTTIAQSAGGICDRIDGATKEDTSGRFVLWEDGSNVPW